jgi:Tat protein translocase TatC
MTSPAKPSGSRNDDTLQAMPLGAHLDELRRRVVTCLLALGAVFLVCWLLRDVMMEVLARPHRVATRAWGISASLKYLGYFEAVTVQFKAALLVAGVVCSPLILFNMWAFVAPGLFPRERSKVMLLGAACTACVLTGVGFGYFIFVPLALRFLIGMAGPSMEPMLTIGSYLGTLIMMMLALGIVFQTPVVVFCLVRWGILKPENLRRHRKAVIMGAFIVGAVLTPPDPMTQIMMAVTLIVLYDLGGIVAAPSRESLLSALRFSGVVALALGAVAAWLTWWPVGEATLSGYDAQAQIGGRVCRSGQLSLTVPLRPNDLCAGLTDNAVLSLRASSDTPSRILTIGKSRLRVSRKSTALLQGRALMLRLDDNAPLVLLAGPLTVDAQKQTRVQVRVKRDAADDFVLEVHVHVLAGRALIKDASGERRIDAGRKESFFYGGTPAGNTQEVEDFWTPSLSFH